MIQLAHAVHLVELMKKWFPILLFTLSACVSENESTPTSDIDPVSWLETNATNYLENQEWRRAQLEASLWMPELPYARKRLEAYGLVDSGWDFLPQMSFTTTRVGGNPVTVEFSDAVPTSREEWLKLGEQVFWDMPMRRDGYLEWLAVNPQIWDEVGIQTDRDGNMRGIVKFEDVTGRQRMGVTCGVCHGDNGVPGTANHKLDLGKARSYFGEVVGANFTEGLEWGPGAVDVTDDNITDPLGIPTLWALEHQSHINRSGAIKLASPAALAIRFETQYIEGHSMMARPNRTHTLALAMYVYSLTSPTQREELSENERGRTIFQDNCASCHNPEKGYGGGLVAASTINSNPIATQSPMRGTGFFKVPTLIGISKSDRFMHDAGLDSLEDVIDSGHPNGSSLDAKDREDLLSFLGKL